MQTLLSLRRLLLALVGLLLLAATSEGLFNKDGKKRKQEKEEKQQQALQDVQMGFAGIRQAAQDPSLMADLMESMRDPEIMAEAQKMMKDPAFQAQMKTLMSDTGMAEAANKARDAMKALEQDPEKMAELSSQLQGMMAEGAARRRDSDLDQHMRNKARQAAGADMGIAAAARVASNKGGAGAMSGATSAELGFKTLKQAATDPSVMADAVKLMNDPAMVQEVQRMMQDPSFMAKLQEFSSDPEFQSAMAQGAKMMNGMMAEPGARTARA